MSNTPKRALKLRPSVYRFAQMMERKLREHDKKKGKRGWMHDCPLGYLEDCILSEMQKEHKDMVDIANFAMMHREVEQHSGEL